MKILIVLVLFLIPLQTVAHDNGQYNSIPQETRDWVNSLKNDKGVGCCATADGIPPQEIEYDTIKDHYRVKIEGEWHDVPDMAVIKEPNKLGYAVVWFYKIGIDVYIRCFLPGAGI